MCRTGRLMHLVDSFWLVVRPAAAATHRPACPWMTVGVGGLQTSLPTPGLQQIAANADSTSLDNVVVSINQQSIY